MIKSVINNNKTKNYAGNVDNLGTGSSLMGNTTKLGNKAVTGNS